MLFEVCKQLYLFHHCLFFLFCIAELVPDAINNILPPKDSEIDCCSLIIFADDVLLRKRISMIHIFKTIFRDKGYQISSQQQNSNETGNGENNG